MVKALEQPMYPGPHLAQRADRISCGTVSRVNHWLACPFRVLPLPASSAKPESPPSARASPGRSRKPQADAARAASVYILMPKQALVFSQSGPALYEGLYSVRDDAPEVHRRLAYDLYRFWEGNDQSMRNLFRAYRVAAGALVLEILLFVALVSDTLV